MKINFPATKKRMIDAGLNLSRWARKYGHVPSTLYRILDGNYPYDTGDVYKSIIKDLKNCGFLVEEQESPDEKAA